MDGKVLSGYLLVLNSIKEKISNARLKAISYVNNELLRIYSEIGNTINQQEETAGWGAKIVEQLARDLKIEFPDMKGLSLRNLRYMREFAKGYPDFLILQQPAAKLEKINNQQFAILQHPAAKLPWTHHQVILDKVKNHDERLFYIIQSAENNWSRNVLALQIEGKLYQRTGKSLNNFNKTLSLPQADLARETFKNPYLFDFINLGKEAQERDMEIALIEHLKSFLLELGRGFAYVGNQYNLEVGGDDFFLDLFFYNTRLHCYVIFELKVGEFKPEFAGKLNFYINTVDAQVKTEEDKPTIGVLLCKTPNETVVQYALKGINAPMGVSDYELTVALPKELKGEIPTIQELEQEIETEYKELKSPAEKKLDALKQKLAGIKTEEFKTPATYDIMVSLFKEGLRPLYEELIIELQPIRDLFAFDRLEWSTFNHNVYTKSLDEMEEKWMDESLMHSNDRLTFRYSLFAFKKLGIDLFNTHFELTLYLEAYLYQFTLTIGNGIQTPILKKLYHQMPSKEDRNMIIDNIKNYLIGEVEKRVEEYQSNLQDE